MFAFVCVLLIAAVFAPASRAAGPLVIAHRGASFHAPENTLAAFQLAWRQGADGIEGDFRLTVDGRIVCIHDEDTKRVAGKQLVVKDASLAALKALDVGAWKGAAWRGEAIPTLEEVLAVVPKGKLLFIELKTGPEIVAPLADVLKRTGLAAEQIVIIAFDEQVITACAKQLPAFRRHLLAKYDEQEDGTWTPGADDVIAAVRRTRADGLGTQNRPAQVNQEFVRRLRAARIDQFHVWTVDDPADARGYERLGAWALTTNRPAELRAALAEER
jgi:glycerophosphoryl diester phosphodiesterase